MLLALMLLACAPEGDVQPEAAVELSAERVVPEQGLERVRASLLARHVEDLPHRSTLGDDAAADLTVLATTDDLMLVRRRALVTLGEYPSDATAALCLELAGSENAPLRGAATMCLSGQDPHRTDVHDALVVAVHDSDARVAVAAVDGLERTDDGRAVLDGLAGDLPEALRARLANR